jgi:sugar lactone lactonase YvrE
MKHRMTSCVAAAVLGSALAFASVIPAGAAPATRGLDVHHRILASFAPAAGGSFAESLAMGKDGTLYASVTDFSAKGTSLGGRVWAIEPGGTPIPFGPILDTGTYGVLSGLAFDGQGRLYVAGATFQTTPKPGVFRIEADGTATRVLTLPWRSFPNGLAFRGRTLFVSDSLQGAIWRVRVGDTPVKPETPWLQDPLLEPKPELGANGIAFRGDDLYVAAYSAGKIIRIPVDHGRPGEPVVVVADRAQLAGADGIVFDGLGHLWITVNGTEPEAGHGSLFRMSLEGRLRPVVPDPGWLDYPTMAVVGSASRTQTTLIVENGSFWGGAPNVMEVQVFGLRDSL